VHVVTKLLGLSVLIIVGSAILAFTSVLESPITADGFFTLRDLVEEVALPVLWAVANFLLYTYLRGPLARPPSGRTRWLVDLATLALPAGYVVAVLGVGVRFVGDELATSYCAAAAGAAWCARAQLFHRELGHLGLFLGNLLIAAALLAVQLSRSEVEDLDLADLACLGLFGSLCGLGLFALVVEGRIVAFGVPILAAYALVTTTACRMRRGQMRRLPLLGYQTVAAWVALTLILVWGIYWRGYPAFTMLSATAPPR
jgi:hypothetical protein